jgi:hypothetical protein
VLMNQSLERVDELFRIAGQLLRYRTFCGT